MGERATAWGAYAQIAETLRRRITDRTWPAGSQLPSEAALSAEFGVARNTLRRALAALNDEGLIVALPGRGRIVRLHGECVPPVPQYRRIADELRASIEAGALKQGDVLPSEAALRARYGVARETVRRALAELEGAGLIASSQGKGWFVLTP